MPDVPKGQLVSNWMRDAGERLRAVERRYQELRQLIEGEAGVGSFGGVRTEVFQTTALSGTTSGTTELLVGTLVVPELPFPSIQVGALTMMSGASLVNGDRFRARIRDTSATGTIRGTVAFYATATTIAPMFPIPTTEFRVVAGGTSATWVATVQREVGSGNIAISTGTGVSTLTVVAYPQPPVEEP